MITVSPVINSITSMLNRPNQRLKARVSLSRILLQLDMRDLPFDEGMHPDRRQDVTRHVSIGIWLIPIDENRSPTTADASLAQPAVTCDLRRQGIGVLIPKQTAANRFLVAVADLDETWRFFLTELRHQSVRPGGWFQLGLDVVKMVDPEPLQLSHFRNRRQSLSRL